VIVITDTIFDNLPFLDRINSNTIDAVNKKKVETLYLLQNSLKKSDADVIDETTYSNQQKLLVAYYTAYRLVEKQALLNIGGVNGEAPVGNVFVTKEKADVVEVEYDIAKSSDGGLLNLNTSEILSGLKLQLCSLAREMNLSLLICKDFCVKAQPVPIMFLTD
jgi:hypothetical protein